MTGILAIYVLGVAALWPRAWEWDDWTDRERLDRWNLVFIVIWPLAASMLAAVIAGDEIRDAWRALFPPARPRERGGEAIRWIA